MSVASLDRVERLRSFARELAAEPHPGMEVGPHVRLEAPLGAGGMGTVWLAEHLTLGVPVAVKLLSSRFADRAEMMDRFRDEARVVARIASAHVVRVLDHGLADGDLPYLVMEKLEGQDVARRIESSGTLDLDETTQIVVEASRGLAAAHGAGIIHRDIKPQNLFLAVEDQRTIVKVLDFGVAKRADAPPAASTTTAAHTWGTPLYMSPEQLASPTTVDRRTDLWSLSVVAYQCLTGRAPFGGETIAALAVAMERGAFEPPSKLRPTLPRAVDAWFARALHRRVEERFATAEELAAAWTAAARGSGRLSLRTWHWAAIAAVVAAGAAGFWITRPEHRSDLVAPRPDPLVAPVDGSPVGGEPPASPDRGHRASSPSPTTTPVADVPPDGADAAKPPPGTNAKPVAAPPPRKDRGF